MTIPPPPVSAPAPPFGAASPDRPFSRVAVAAAVCSALGPLLGQVLVLPGLVLGVIALVRIRLCGQRGRWLAVTAIVVALAQIAFIAALVVLLGFGNPNSVP